MKQIDSAIYSSQASKYGERIKNFNLKLDEILEELELVKSQILVNESDSLAFFLNEFDKDVREHLKEIRKISDRGLLNIKNKAFELDEEAKQRIIENSNNYNANNMNNDTLNNNIQANNRVLNDTTTKNNKTLFDSTNSRASLDKFAIRKF